MMWQTRVTTSHVDPAGAGRALELDPIVSYLVCAAFRVLTFNLGKPSTVPPQTSHQGRADVHSVQQTSTGAVELDARRRNVVVETHLRSPPLSLSVTRRVPASYLAVAWQHYLATSPAAASTSVCDATFPS